jgi:hypothetical protein
VRGFILLTLYTPTQYAELARILDGLLTGDLSALAGVDGSSLVTAPSEPRYGIQCGDKFKRFDRLADARGPVERLIRKSSIAGDTTTYQTMLCARWKMEAKERYEGDFRVKTKTPVLAIGNTWDPVTPFLSAQNITYTFEGSVALRQNGFGVS